jgi:hypothetical protein
VEREHRILRLFQGGPARQGARSVAPALQFIVEALRRKGWPAMSGRLLYVLLLLLFAAGVASAATIFGSPSGVDDFCFGYAICE